jgi:hypothetical protein
MKKFIFIFLQNHAKFRTTINAFTYRHALYKIAKTVHPSNIIEGFEIFHAILEDFQIPFKEMANVCCQPAEQ